MTRAFGGRRSITAAVTWLLGLMAASAAIADPNDGRYYHHHGMMDWSGWIFGPIMLLIFFGLLVGAIVLAVRVLGVDGFRPTGQSHDNALSILRERFAKGEISAEEFDAAKKTLE